MPSAVITVASDGWRWEIAEIAEVPTAEVPTEIFAQEQKQKLGRIKFERRCVPKEALGIPTADGWATVYLLFTVVNAVQLPASRPIFVWYGISNVKCPRQTIKIITSGGSEITAEEWG